MLKDYLGIGIFLAVGLVMPLIILAVSALLQKISIRYAKTEGPAKYETYECGIETKGDTWVQFKTSYFLYALVFVVFDVEAIFLFPWAVTFQELGTPAFIKMFIFITILVVGFWHAWKEGALEWK
ncbi:NADH-quinone oxidoreductase subunit A [Heliorestis acidaminivorans]|uniref:NADH-quinone oxidoreductase subunit A n=1 Tax=Heliorestis acidaminivorans TaxID=553427 RepID=A0A6I0F3T3_9FIRM|nr:NADH-quinone oxidoreductase subunit A [Heliorestis acidaminivorans]KAB2954420.1 NADH-quinone oxidoreductase subunit A [Heliorestis acidaminivorans]